MRNRRAGFLGDDSGAIATESVLLVAVLGAGLVAWALISGGSINDVLAKPAACIEHPGPASCEWQILQ